jgi:GT2 family glycosyltransferase
VRYLWSRSVGVSRARNLGIAAARQAVLAFIDDDVLAAPTWLERLVQALVAAGPGSVVTGQVRPTEAPAPGAFAPSLKVDESGAVHAGRVGQDVLYSNNMALPRAALEAVGGFDSRLGPGARFSAAEDNDLGFRLLEAGYRIVYVPEAVAYHRAWRAQREYLPLLWRYGRGQGAYCAKHLSLRDRYMLGRLVRHTLRHAARGVGLARRQRFQACAEGVYVLGLLAGAAEWLLTETGRDSPEGRPL